MHSYLTRQLIYIIDFQNSKTSLHNSVGTSIGYPDYLITTGGAETQVLHV